MEDEDELLQSATCTDEESLSESEDQCIPQEKPEETDLVQHLYTDHTKFEFFVVKSLLILSSTAIIILLPLYLDSINKNSDVFVMFNFTSIATCVLIAFITFSTRRFCPKIKNINLCKPPLGWSKMILMLMIYLLMGFMIVFAVDRKRVMCHLQDPIKGVVLVFSLVNYFFFCQKMMGLQRIFSATTIIVGLFITVDYGLCDEFRCRGNEREHRSDDAGNWSWQTHSIWAAIYIVGLYLFATFYTLLDRYLISSETIIPSSLSNHLLATISRIVAFQNSTSQLRTITTSSNKKNMSPLHFVLYLQGFSMIISCLVVFLDVVPFIGAVDTFPQLGEFLRYGFLCHFSFSENSPTCGYTAVYGWLFIVAYLIFLLCSIRFLILCQSAVYTLATMTTSLPLVGIWWSLFKMDSTQIGLLDWSPSVTGELICALLGLPIVIIGLTLLCKNHFRDCKLSKMNMPCLTATQLA
ncbi:uncharacterized protein [Onthophagus taurus]|uniref:uncharacterized protein n=1 Tax=Onthophagus taurus TaxID=166361 RepID=UPI0039BEA542